MIFGSSELKKQIKLFKWIVPVLLLLAGTLYVGYMSEARGLLSPDKAWVLSNNENNVYLSAPGPHLFASNRVYTLERGRILSCRWEGPYKIILSVTRDAKLSPQFYGTRFSGIQFIVRRIK